MPVASGACPVNQDRCRAPTRGPSRDSPRVLARCHGAQRVRALRARGRPSRATREPAASSDSPDTRN